MKKCEYCGKEITYFEQYCSEDCQRNAIKYYDKVEKFTNIFAIINCVCIFGIPIGIIIFSFANAIGATVLAASLVILGLTISMFPFPVENMITKHKIEKAQKLTRVFGFIILGLGIIASVAAIILFIK